MARTTQAGLLLGTVGYMSPEQIRGELADSRSDIFSFGCVLFGMLSGRRAFQKKTAIETLNAILKEDPPPLVPSSGGMPVNLERIVRRCLEKRPEDRFASASDLHFALQSLLQAPTPESASKEPPEKSIVVLPFENLSPDPENAYFADGLTEEIISDLAKVRALRECYLKARREIWRWVGPSLDKAMEYLEQGLRVVPDNPLLLAGMAYVHFQRVNMGIGEENSLEKAETFATRALDLAPDLPQGHLLLGLTAAWRRGMIKTAIAHFERVLAADPNDQDGLKWTGVFYAYVGKLAEAASMGEKVIAMDPMSPMSYMPLMFSLWLDGRFDAALEVLERACKVDPSSPIIKHSRVHLLISMGRHEEAVALAGWAEKEERLTIFHRMALLWRYALVGDREKALSWMTPGALQTCRRDFQYSWWVACAYVMLGDAESALDWLENAIELGFLNHRYLSEIDPLLAPLRADPRFQALMSVARDQAKGLEA